MKLINPRVRYTFVILSNRTNTFIIATTAPPRSVIETHGMSTQGQRLPSAMELSLHKIQRERQMAQALIDQRQLSSNYGLNVGLFLFVFFILLIR